MLVTDEFYRKELTHRRERARLAQGELAGRLNISPSYLSQIEGGSRRSTLKISQRLDEELDTDGLFERMTTAIENVSKVADYFEYAEELESQAATINEYASGIVPGLLQTSEYARALTRETCPDWTSEEVEKSVYRRMERAAALEDSGPPVVRVVLHEAVLGTPVGSGATMHGQLMHIVSLARRKRITVQIVEAKEGAHALMGSQLRLMTFADKPPVAYIEGAYSGQLLEDGNVVENYNQAFEMARAHSLPVRRSLALIESAAKEHLDDNPRAFQ